MSGKHVEIQPWMVRALEVEFEKKALVPMDCMSYICHYTICIEMFKAGRFIVVVGTRLKSC